MPELVSLLRLTTYSAKIRLLQMVIQSSSLMQVLFITSRGEFLSPSAAAGSYSAKATSISYLSYPAERACALVDGHASTILPCSDPVEQTKFLRTVASLKLWFYFVIHGFTLATESDNQIRICVCQCRGWESQWGSVRGAEDLTRWIQFQCSSFNASILP